MIVSDLEHADQVPMPTCMKKAFDFLRRPDIHDIPDGKVDIEPGKIYAILQRYDTLCTDAPLFEFHRKYIDVQYIVSGEEVMGWVPADRMNITEPYNPEKDISFGTVAPGDATFVSLRSGQFAVFFPEDGHAPKLSNGEAKPVFKIVVKIAIDQIRHP